MAGRRRAYNVTIILAALVVAIVIAVVAGTTTENGEPTGGASPSAATSAAGTPSPTPRIVQAGEVDVGGFVHPNPTSLTLTYVTDVIDGDTIDALIGGREERVRLYGVDVPERGDRCAGEATDRTEELIKGGVRLEPGPRERDRYGRLLAYVYTADGLSVDAQLIAEGLAYAWRDDGQHRNDFVAIEESARAAGTGCLWK